MVISEKFGKAVIFDNTALNLDGLAVLSQTGCDYVVNFQLFNPDRTSCCDLKADNRWLAHEGWIPQGIGWSENNIPCAVAQADADKYENFVTCTDVQPNDKRGRMGIGFTPDGRFIIDAVGDGPEAQTVAEEQAILDAQGCNVSIRMDGGSSPQVHKKGAGTLLACQRGAGNNVATYLCLWVAVNSPKPVSDEVATAEQWAINNGIVKGNGTDYGWGDTTTKLQNVLMLYRMSHPGAVTPPTATPDPVTPAPASDPTPATPASLVKLNGLDVSEHQGIIDWDKIKPQIDFAILRAGYGHNNIDKQFVRNASECTRLGIPFGVYWFSYAYTPDMAAQEAAYCLAAIKPYHLSLPIVFDYEYDSVSYASKLGKTITKALASSLVTAFCDAIEKAGRYAMMYANRDYLSRYFDPALLQKYDLWYAQYPDAVDVTNPPQTCGIWQFASAGTIQGISGNVDLNASYKDYLKLIK